MNLEDIRNLVIKKEKSVTTDEEQKKINLIKEFLKDDKCFFNIPIETAIAILYFLGIKEENIKEVYFNLISYENFSKNNIVRNAVDI